MKTQNKTLYEYIEPYLEHGDENIIKEARKRFYREYKAEWRRKRRREQKEYTVSFCQSELQQITEAAKCYQLSVTQFIKSAALTTSSMELLMPNDDQLRKIDGLLEKNYCLLERIEEQMDNNVMPNSLLPQFENLKQQILAILKPKPA